MNRPETSFGTHSNGQFLNPFENRYSSSFNPSYEPSFSLGRRHTRHRHSRRNLESFFPASPGPERGRERSPERGPERGHSGVASIPNRIFHFTFPIEAFEEEAFDPNSDIHQPPEHCSNCSKKEVAHLGLSVQILERKQRDEVCVICQDGQSVFAKVLKCGHFFHISCIDKWLSKQPNKECPLCRTEH